MTLPVMPLVPVAPIPCDPYPGGLYRAAQLRDELNWSLLYDGGFITESNDACVTASVWDDPSCCDPAQPAPAPKTTPGKILITSGTPITVYAGKQCPAGAVSPADMAAARERLAIGEQKRVETSWWAQMAATATVPVTGPQPLATALAALLKAIADAGLTCLPTLHAPHWLMAHMTAIRADLLTTVRWALGMGYPGTEPTGQLIPAAGQAWIYATGPMVIYRSPVEAKQTVDITGCQIAIAERTVVPATDCPLPYPAVLADPRLCCTPPAAQAAQGWGELG